MDEPKLKLLNFVSASQTDVDIQSIPSEAQQKEEVYDDRPLFEILKENADKKDAEFNERFKHRPPKALDEDEAEFLDALETYRKQQEQEAADAEERELSNFHTAIASRTVTTEEVKPLTAAAVQSERPSLTSKRPQPKLPLAVAFKIKSQPKKPRLESPPPIIAQEEVQNVSATEKVEDSNCLGLVAYSDESDDEQ